MASAMSVTCSGAKTNYFAFAEKVKFCYSALSNRAPNCDRLLEIRLAVIITYGTSQDLQQILEFVKKGKAPNHIFKIELCPSAPTSQTQYDFPP